MMVAERPGLRAHEIRNALVPDPRLNWQNDGRVRSVLKYLMSEGKVYQTGRPVRYFVQTKTNASMSKAGLELASKLTLLNHEAHYLGLHITGHAINRAVKAIGWEIAGDRDKAAKESAA